VYTLRVQSFFARHRKQVFDNVTTDLCGTWLSGYAKAITTTGNFNFETALNLTQVFVKLTAKIGKAVVVGGLQDEVPGYFGGVQWSGITPSDKSINDSARLPRTNVMCIANLALKAHAQHPNRYHNQDVNH
jgi:hypothetical protein